MSSLKECCVCGSIGAEIEEGYWNRVKCKCCSASTSFYRYKEDAINSWNKMIMPEVIKNIPMDKEIPEVCDYCKKKKTILKYIQVTELYIECSVTCGKCDFSRRYSFLKKEELKKWKINIDDYFQ